jgi:hypothetical protein
MSLRNFFRKLAAPLDAWSEGLAPYPLDFEKSRWGYTDADGNVAFRATFEGAQPFSEGHAAVELGSKWGYINRRGEIVIPCRYALAGPFREGLARVSLDCKKWGFIDFQGKVVIPFKYDGAQDFQSSHARVELGGKSGTIDRSGDEHF